MRDADPAYTQRLLQRQGVWWKRLFHVQAPYRWNIRRLQLGFVLDIGCGIGRNLLHLDGNGVGVDHNPDSLRVCRERGLTVFSPQDFASSGFAEHERFDSLLIAHVAEHMPFADFVGLLRQYKPFLKTGGRAIVITPQEAGYRSDPTHCEFMDFAKHAEALQQAGLTIQSRYSFPFPHWVGRFFRHNEFITIGIKLGG